MPTDTNSRRAYIKEMQVARGVGIMLVTFGHSEPVAVVFPYAWHVIYSFHMPLFFFMSGFFSVKLIKKSWLKEIVPQTARLYIPYLFISFSYGLIKLLVPSLAKRPVEVDEMVYQILLYPFENPALFLWFLYVLLLLRLLSPLLRARQSFLLFPIFLVTACWYGSIDLFGIWGVLKYFAYYHCGLLVADRQGTFFNLLRSVWLRICFVLIFAFFSFLGMTKWGGGSIISMLTAFAGIWMALSISFLSIPDKLSKWIEYIGGRSLEIYLLQYYFIFPVLFGLRAIGIDPIAIVLCTFIAGLAGPIAISHLLLPRLSLLSLLLIGQFKKPNPLRRL